MEDEVRTVMTRNVVSALPGTTFKELVGLIESCRISALPVVDMDRRVLGVVSEADLLLRELYPDSERRRHWLSQVVDSPIAWAQKLAEELKRASGRTAAELMTSPAHTISEQASIAEAARKMHDAGVKRLPVVDAEGKLVGLVTRSDLLSVFFYRSDRSLRREVERALEAAGAPAGLRVIVDDGVVRLLGYAPPAAVAAAEKVPGVVEVVTASATEAAHSGA